MSSSPSAAPARSKEKKPPAAASHSPSPTKERSANAAPPKTSSPRKSTSVTQKSASRTHVSVPHPVGQLGPELPAAVVKYAKLTAMERVKQAYKEAKALTKSKPFAAMRSHTARDPYEQGPRKGEAPTKEAVKRDAMITERVAKASAETHYDPCSTKLPSSFDAAAAVSPANGSSWAKSLTQRGTYSFNWSKFPRNTPTARGSCPATPGPGQYTSALHMVGL